MSALNGDNTTRGIYSHYLQDLAARLPNKELFLNLM